VRIKNVLLITGIVFILISAVSIGQYVSDYGELSDYEKGFIWGQFLILTAGLVLTYFGIKRKKS